VSDGPEPTRDDVPLHAIPATYRRAPRSERFVLTGIALGGFIGFVLGLILPAGDSLSRGVAGLLVGLAGALAGGLVGGSQVAILEYTSGRSSDRQRLAIEDDWAPVDGLAPDFPTTGAFQAASSKDDEGADDGSR